MCVDPFTVISTVATVGSGIASYNSSKKQGKAAMQDAIAEAKDAEARKEAAEFNAVILEKNAQFVEDSKVTIREQGDLDLRRLADDKSANIGSQRVSAAARGIDADYGTPQDLQDDTEKAYQIDRNITMKNTRSALRDADIEIFNYKAQALLTRKQGASYDTYANQALAAGARAQEAANENAGLSLLQMGANVANMWRPSGRTTTSANRHTTQTRVNFSTQPSGSQVH